MKKKIAVLKKAFLALKDSVRKCLKKRRVLVERVADVLTSLSPDDDENHRLFLASHMSILYKAANVSELFGTMNLHWNYLNPSLLDHLVKEFDLEEVKEQMEAYNSDLQQFRMTTQLTLFCRVQKRKRARISPDFREVVAEFDWPENVTLEVVEQFRRDYAHHYNLHECAIMVAQIRDGSFIVTWFVPESVVEKLKGKVPREILKKHSVTKLEIAGTCVYRLRKPQEVSVTGSIPAVSSHTVPLSFHYQAVPSTSSGPVSAATATLPG